MRYVVKLAIQKVVEAQSDEDLAKKRGRIVKDLECEGWSVDVDDAEEEEEEEKDEDELGEEEEDE